ncbi:Uncharacterized membrane protein YfcA [Thalassotalea agarivorans]|uniref:Probable membrane transporter protein n=2 Tax=Thalassotalea agarivorans TaxID=349064 RepID=A0A1I0BKI1_THASX|nr:Uncharacterized membrane protein YfcA [Thalassotalea agarivorans]
MIITGVASGILAGLLGVGGGIVIVPVLDFMLRYFNLADQYSMHIAVATSLTCIVFTGLSSAYAHYRKGKVDVNLVLHWALPLVLGSILGVFVATKISSLSLSIIFACIATLVGLKMLLGITVKTRWQKPPKGIVGASFPTAIGSLSAMMGIGGGTLSVPVLTMMNKTIHQAVATSAVFGVIISLPSAVSFIVAGWHQQNLPLGNLGYVNWIAVGAIIPLSMACAPLGAKLAHRLPKHILAKLFGVFLLLVSLKMVLKTLG